MVIRNKYCLLKMEKQQKYMNSIKRIGLTLITAILIYGCSGSEYQQLVQRELASGVRNDTLFFGIHFGNTTKEFYAKCWELNKEGVIGHGPKNMNVMYTLGKINGSTVDMLFYPTSDSKGKIRKMDLEFYYNGWAPWNEQYAPEKLVPVLQDTLEAWYPGNSFMELDIEEETYWVKVDGNRRITMKSSKGQAVLVKMVDMLNEEN